MQDPICAMKILRRPKFSVPNRNLVRPELRAARRPESRRHGLSDRFHNLRQTPAVSSLHGPTIGRNSAHLIFSPVSTLVC